MKQPTKDEVDQITHTVIGAAIEVHRRLGPGLLESAYEACLAYELGQRRVRFERQKTVPVVYKGQRLDCGYRMDLLVEEKVVVEVKAVEQLTNVHKAQLLSYLKLSGCNVGLLMNFNVEVLAKGLRRMVNQLKEQ